VKLKDAAVIACIMVVWVPFSIISFVCMLPILWGVGRMIGAIDMTLWEFTRVWFSGEWL
jgi:hypothetical protein